MKKQTAIDNRKSLDRRRFGQFATPPDLAREIMAFGLKLQKANEISFLELALGTGSFYSALLAECNKQSKTLKTAVGIELDKDFFAVAKDLWGKTAINLLAGDFTETRAREKVNLLITNPPYVRHHYLTPQQKLRLSTMIRKETGFSLSGLAGLYCYFILAAHKWLAPNAVCGWLIPSEFMDVNYGSVLKEYLLNKVHLLRVHRYNPKNRKFADALVSSCVIWYKNETVQNDYEVEFSYGSSHESPEIRQSVTASSLKKSRKWTHFCNKIDNNGQQSDSVSTLGD